MRLRPAWFASSVTNESYSPRTSPRAGIQVAVARHGCPADGPADRHPAISRKLNRGGVATLWGSIRPRWGRRSGSDDPCFGQTACIVCPKDALPPEVHPFSGAGLRVPVDFTATPDGAVVQGGTVSIEVAGRIVVSIPLSAEASVSLGSTSTYGAVAGGDGALDIVIPEQVVAGDELVIDAGSGSADFTVADDATELVIELGSIVLNLIITSPLEIDLPLDASQTGGCTIEGDGVAIPVEAAP